MSLWTPSFPGPCCKRFQAETGIKVLAKFDVESTKTVGLTNEIIAEAARPRCDVFWNNESSQYVAIGASDLLLAVRLAATGAYSRSRFVPADATWTGFAARARVLLVNTERLPEPDKLAHACHGSDRTTVAEQVGMAKPLFGTTATHATVLMHRWNEEKFRKFFAAVRDNARIYSGNKQVALAVARGTIDWGLTDTDDAIIEVDRGMPVRSFTRIRRRGQMGTLLIPNTVCVIKGTSHADLAASWSTICCRRKSNRIWPCVPAGKSPWDGMSPGSLVFSCHRNCERWTWTLFRLPRIGMHVLVCCRNCLWEILND